MTDWTAVWTHRDLPLQITLTFPATTQAAARAGAPAHFATWLRATLHGAYPATDFTLLDLRPIPDTPEED